MARNGITVTPAHIRHLDGVGFVIQWILVGAAVWVGLSIPLLRERPAMPDLASASTAHTVPAEPMSLRSAGDLKGIWERDLRQTLVQPKPAPTKKPKPSPPPPQVKLPKLLATFVEKGEAWGLFENRRGEQRVRSATGRVDDFDILRIAPGRAELGRDGNRYEVTTAQRGDRGRG